MILWIEEENQLKDAILRLFIHDYIGRDGATGWTILGLNPGGGEIFSTCPDRPWDPPSLLYNGYQVLSRGRAARVWH